jgi:hypothetical protein
VGSRTGLDDVEGLIVMCIIYPALKAYDSLAVQELGLRHLGLNASDLSNISVNLLQHESLFVGFLCKRLGELLRELTTCLLPVSTFRLFMCY